jgi:hypothetical protein
MFCGGGEPSKHLPRGSTRKYEVISIELLDLRNVLKTGKCIFF